MEALTATVLAGGADAAIAFGALVASTASAVAMWKSIRQKGEATELDDQDRRIARLEHQLERCRAELDDERGRNLRLMKRLLDEE